MLEIIIWKQIKKEIFPKEKLGLWGVPMLKQKFKWRSNEYFWISNKKFEQAKGLTHSILHLWAIIYRADGAR